MKISARVENSEGQHRVSVQTGRVNRAIEIAPKESGFGSSVNGGELLFLALATCYCNDIYREAGKRGIKVERIEVEVQGEFPADGEPAASVTYRAKIAAHAGQDEIRALMSHTDRVAEIQNTLRAATPVALMGVDIEAL